MSYLDLVVSYFVMLQLLKVVDWIHSFSNGCKMVIFYFYYCFFMKLEYFQGTWLASPWSMRLLVSGF